MTDVDHPGRDLIVEGDRLLAEGQFDEAVGWYNRSLAVTEYTSSATDQFQYYACATQAVCYERLGIIRTLMDDVDTAQTEFAKSETSLRKCFGLASFETDNQAEIVQEFLVEAQSQWQELISEEAQPRWQGLPIVAGTSPDLTYTYDVEVVASLKLCSHGYLSRTPQTCPGHPPAPCL